MRIFITKEFARFAKKEGISTIKLCEVVKDLEHGKIDAGYGGHVIKQRIARSNEGKSGGYRVIVIYRKNDKAFFVHGFSKNEKETLSSYEERLYKDAAKIILEYSDFALFRYLKRGIYKEVNDHDKEI